MDKLISQPWYFENAPPDKTGSYITTAVREDGIPNKVNYFLVRDGSDNNPTQYTLEVCLYTIPDFVQKFSCTDLQTVIAYANSLTHKSLLKKKEVWVCG